MTEQEREQAIKRFYATPHPHVKPWPGTGRYASDAVCVSAVASAQRPMTASGVAACAVRTCAHEGN